MAADAQRQHFWSCAPAALSFTAMKQNDIFCFVCLFMTLHLCKFTGTSKVVFACSCVYQDARNTPVLAPDHYSQADAILEREQHAQQQGPGAPASVAGEAPTGVMGGEPPLEPPSTAFTPLMPQEGPKQPSAGLRVSEATQYLETVPSRRGPTRAEMEAINTGGADF
uniref:Uncharacterized protein n=1 Tax=Dunaliella tertiolecta TaxID=3047 RepID=A0A7S3VIG7_DUNTE